MRPMNYGNYGDRPRGRGVFRGFGAMAAVCCLLPALSFAEPVPLADPFVLYDGGTYYAYGTGSADGIPVMTSTDLENWTPNVGGAKGGLALHKDDSFGERHFWAPEVYKVEGGYAMCYSAEEHVLFAFAKSPLGPFVQEEKKPLFDFKAIDGSIFRDDDGRVWLFFVKVENGNVIYQVEMERDLRKCRPETMRKVFGATEKWELRNPNCHVAEGPFVVKVDGTYVLTYSANGYTDKDYALGAATAKSVEGPWTKYAGNPILRRRFGLVGTGHHSFFRDAQGKWKIAFHAHNTHDKIHPRLMHIADVEFVDANGTVVPDIGSHIDAVSAVVSRGLSPNETTPNKAAVNP